MQERLVGVGRIAALLAIWLLFAGLPLYLWREHEDTQRIAHGEQYEWYHVVETVSDRDADLGAVLDIKLVGRMRS